MFDVLESTRDNEEAVNAVQHLIFNTNHSPEAIVASLEIAEKYFEPEQLIDRASRKELETLYLTPHTKPQFSMPDILKNWKGDFRQGTKEIYKIARGEVTNEEVEDYQNRMRSQLPRQIPLVRGGRPNHGRDLCSWSASVYTAQVYSDTQIAYTVVSPEDVFMCSLYGDEIGEQEYTLTNYQIQETYSPTLENQIILNRKMANVLS